jgi:hypothetical protein
MVNAMPGAADPAVKDEAKTDDLRWATDKFSQGPKRAIAKAVARLLRSNQAYPTLLSPHPRDQLLG